MKTVLKRVAAYMLDITLVSIISTLLTSNSIINKDYNKYMETYDKYEVVYEEYTDKLDDLESELEDEEITHREYDDEVEKVNQKYEGVLEDYNYKLIKLSIIPTSISLIIVLLYFGLLQYYLNGQTIGKKVLKLQIKSNNDKKLNIFNYILRCLILNEVLINILSIIFILILNKNNYLVYNNIIYTVSYVIEMAIVFTLFFNKNNRGLHDYISNTKVIDLREKEGKVDEM